MLRVAGELTDGTILWMGNARAVETHVAPRLSAAASAAGRPQPRIVAGLPVAVHDDVDEARQAAAAMFAGYGDLPNYRRLLDIGGVAGPADAAIVGDEASVESQIQDLFDAGATDVWAAIFPVGSDKRESRARTRALLADLANRPEPSPDALGSAGSAPSTGRGPTELQLPPAVGTPAWSTEPRSAEAGRVDLRDLGGGGRGGEIRTPGLLLPKQAR